MSDDRRASLTVRHEGEKRPHSSESTTPLDRHGSTTPPDRHGSTTPPDRHGSTTAWELRADIRGVQWTLEAFLAVLLLLAALVVVAAVLPVGTQQAEAEITQTKLQQSGDDVLTLAKAEGNLTAAILYWDTADGEFVDTDADIATDPHYVTFSDGDDQPLAALLAGTLGEQYISYNIHIEYETGEVAPVTERRPLVYQGPPGGDSVTASTTVLLFEDDRPHATAGDCTLAELDNESSCGSEEFYAPNVDPTSNRYNTVQVQITLWRV